MTLQPRVGPTAGDLPATASTSMAFMDSNLDDQDKFSIAVFDGQQSLDTLGNRILVCIASKFIFLNSPTLWLSSQRSLSQGVLVWPC